MDTKLKDLNALEKLVALDLQFPNRTDLFKNNEIKSNGIIYRGTRVIHNDKRGSCIITVQRSSRDDELIIGEYGLNFEWGNRTQLSENSARAILMDYFEDNIPEVLVKLFKIEFISLCDFNGWMLTEDTLKAWLEIKCQQYESLEKDENNKSTEIT